MRFVVTNEQMKAAERLCNERYISYSAMMRNAGNAAAARISEEFEGKARVCVLCGSGNNGGDGFVIARRLLESGADVTVISVFGGEEQHPQPKTAISRENFALLPKEIVLDFPADRERSLQCLERSDYAVDCIFGTGFHGKLPESVADLLKSANNTRVKIAVDVPTGVNSDTGEADENCFRPDITLVLAAMKKGLISPVCSDIIGKIEILDIGIPDDCFKGFSAKITDNSVGFAVPERRRSANKGTYGRLLNIAGSVCYSGAAALSTKAALRMGAGLCTLGCPVSVVRSLAPAVLETTFLPLNETADGFVSNDNSEKIGSILPKMNAVSIGCGLGNSKNTQNLTEFVIKNARCPIIIDADGINSICGNINVLRERTSEVVLTPHPLEFSRISGLSVAEISRDRIKAARDFSEEYGVTVLLKGAFTVIAGGGEVYVNPTGCASLAKGGSGDVLTGVIAALLAQGAKPLHAAVSGAYLHGLAGEMAAEKMPDYAVLASDVIDNLRFNVPASADDGGRRFRHYR